jgi:hypothetical protein
MDCSDFMRLVERYRDGSLSRYARAVFEWHRAACPRCAVATARRLRAATASRGRGPAEVRVS